MQPDILEPVEPGSIDVVHSSHAVPFTCKPVWESIRLAADSIHVLREGGYGIIQPILPPMVHRHLEWLISQPDAESIPVVEATHGLAFARSLAMTAFCGELLEKQKEGKIEIAVTRHVLPECVDDRRPTRPLSLPSHLIFRRIAS